MSRRTDVVFGSRGARDLHCDIWSASGPDQHRTAVIIVHGGGWSMGNKTDVHQRCAALAELGFVTIAAEYRLTGEAPWPGQLHDVKTLIAWTCAHAGDLGIEPDRIVLEGHSAGGQLVLMAAGTAGMSEFDPPGESISNPVAAVVCFYALVQLVPGPVPDFVNAPPTPDELRALTARSDGSSPLAAMLLGPDVSEQDARAASPTTYLSTRFPPTMIFQGTDDPAVDGSAPRLLFDTLEAMRVPVELHLIAGVGHEFDADPSFYAACAPQIALFIERYASNLANSVDTAESAGKDQQ